MRHQRLNTIAFSGYVNHVPVMVFNVKNNTEAMWVFLTEYDAEYMRLLSDAYGRN